MTTVEPNELLMPTKTPVLVTQSSMPPFDEYVAEIAGLWDSKWLTNRGDKVRALEMELSEYLRIENGTLFTNGHLALETLLAAMDLEGEVVTTPFTFASTTHAVVRNGLTPVFADIKPDDYTLDPASVEAAITPRTSAILGVHVYGCLSEVDALQATADKHGLALIFDAAHAFGVTRDGVGAGAFGDASMFSFHATKVFNTIEGGLATVKDPTVVDRLHRLQNFGIASPERVVDVAGNGKMNEFAAAMGLCNLRYVDREISRRAAVAATYRENLAGVPGITFLPEQAGVTTNHSYLPIRVTEAEFGINRDQIHEGLKEHGVISRKYFYPLISDFEVYSDRFDSNETPVAQQASREVLALPMYADLAPEDISGITRALLNMHFEGRV